MTPERRVEDVQEAARHLPGGGSTWRVVRRADTQYILQTWSLIGGGHWHDSNNVCQSLTDALDVALSLFSTDVQVWPVIQ